MAMNILPAKIKHFEHFERRLQFKAGLAGSAGGRLKPHWFMGSRVVNSVMEDPIPDVVVEYCMCRSECNEHFSGFQRHVLWDHDYFEAAA